MRQSYRSLPLPLHLNFRSASQASHESLSTNADAAHLACKVGPPLHRALLYHSRVLPPARAARALLNPGMHRPRRVA